MRELLPLGADLKDAAKTPGGLEAISVPLFAGLSWLVCGFSTRAGGASTAYRAAEASVELKLGIKSEVNLEFNSELNPELNSGLNLELNLGFTAEDAPEIVTANRKRLLKAIVGARGSFAGLVTVRQTHSAVTHRVCGKHMLDVASRPTLEGDGLMTDEAGVLLGILTADCVPVVIVDPLCRAVAVFHAGWRGTVERIVEHGVARMKQEFGSEPATLLAAIGPAIGACCYRVGTEVVERFTSRFAYAHSLLSTPVEGDGLHLDLVEANRRQLVEAGLPEQSIYVVGACTSCDDRFFSYRAKGGTTGRMMAVVGLRET